MPPRGRVLSWHARRRTGVVVRWQILAGRGPGRGRAIIVGKACRGLAVVLGKGLAVDLRLMVPCGPAGH